MKHHKVLLINTLLIISTLICKGQTTTIDFTITPYINAGNNTWDPNYWDNGGCGGSKKFGPNPLPLNGHNIRAVGGTYMRNGPPRYFILSAARNGVDPDVKVHNDWNSILSIEYSFAANKSYLIEFRGLKSEGAWDLNYNEPARYKKAVFWIKLDDSPVISTPSQNPCGYDLHPVEKSVGRYSKLIADPTMAYEAKTYSVKFSPKENKSALKIIHDPSPADPNLSFHSQFALYYVKITEVPYEEDGPRYSASYSNAPRPPRGTPGYDITSINDPSTTPTNPGRSTYNDFTIPPNQWILDYNGLGYSVYLKDIIPNFNFSTLINVIVKGDAYTNPRTGQVSNENIILPGSYQNNQYEYQLINGEVVISVKNATNTIPSVPVNGQITYYQ